MVAANAYQHAVTAFRQELSGRGANCAWIGQSTSMDDVLQVVGKAQQVYEDSSWKESKPIKWINEFASSVTNYNAVLGILATADPIHAGLAWGAMRFLLEAVMGYSQLISQLAKSFARIGKALSRAYVLIATYRTSWMQDAVSHLYKTILSFLYNAVKWYKQWTPWRFVSSSLKPWKISFQGTIDEINLCVDNVYREAETAGHARVRDMFIMSEQQQLVQLQTIPLLQRVDNSVAKLLKHATSNEPISCSYPG